MAYTYEEALNSSLDYFDGDQMRATTFLQKYALKSLDGSEYYELNPDHMHQRLAEEFHRIEQQFDNPLPKKKIYEELKGFGHIIPNGSPMAAIGNDIQLMSASNCFVAGNTADSYSGIMAMDQDLAQIMKRRGGVGIDISHLRPKGENVRNAAQSSTGAVSFMERYSETTREVAQDGRRGALMITMHIRHPDAEDFISIKSDETSVTGANVSLKVTDDFMRAVYNDDTFTLRWPVNASPEEAQVTKEVEAKKVWHDIVDTARDHAEPGVLFWDQIQRENPADCYSDLGYKTHSTNPCGEVPLEIGGACRLTAMNLFSFVRNPFTEDAYFDFDKFRESTRIAQRIMDDIVQLDIEKIEQIIDKVESDDEPEWIKGHERRLWQNILDHAKESRRTGLGLTSLGDMLAALGMRYGSEESIEFTDKVLQQQKQSAYRESVNLAKERGSFDIYDAEREKGNPFIERLREEDEELVEEMEEHGRRNIAVLSIAPTGTVSQMAETTSGIENLYMPYYQRRRKVNPNDEEVEVDYVDKVGDAWQEFIVFHPRFEQWLEVKGVRDEIDTKDPDMERLEELKKESPYDGATVSDVDWVNKVKLQGVIQKHIDHSISVTTNLPEDIETERVKDVYEQSWRSGCKGCTIYRQGSRSGVLTEAGEGDDGDGITYHDAPDRPEELECDIHQVRYSGEPWKILIGRLDGDPYEVFAIKTGGDTGIRIRFTNTDGEKVDEGIIRKVGSGEYTLEAKDGKTIVEDIADYAPDDQARVATRLLSLAMRHGVKPEYIVNQLEKANGSVVSFGRAVLKALRRYLDVEPDEACPSCGEDSLVYQEGCVQCKSCGYSKCG